MADVERRVQGSHMEDDKEIQLLIGRYISEGRPDSLAYLSEVKKQVRFD